MPSFSADERARQDKFAFAHWSFAGLWRPAGRATGASWTIWVAAASQRLSRLEVNTHSWLVMALEIERKFLVAGDAWRRQVVRTRAIRQAYLTKDEAVSLRVRIDGTQSATLTIKAARRGIERHEFEYPIPIADADTLLQLRDGIVISKTRHIVPHGGLTWEVDVFEGDNRGLVIAEVELENADQTVDRPDWLGEEVSGDRKYFNASLSLHPYSQW